MSNFIIHYLGLKSNLEVGFAWVIFLFIFKFVKKKRS